MRSFWSDPYLWLHLAGLAALPIFLELCLVGFAIGDPILPSWLELLLVGIVGIAPILWMQWQRPFYIFSLIALALKPEQLTEDQRRLLTLFKSPRNRILAAIVPILLLIVLRQAYYSAAIAAEVLPFSTGWHGSGLLLAAVAFLGSNLFLQVPVAVASVMATSESEFAATTPYPTEQVRQSFTLLGLPINRILPAVQTEPGAALAISDTHLTPPAASNSVDEAEVTAVDFNPEIPPSVPPATNPELPEPETPVEPEPTAPPPEATTQEP